MSEEPRSWFPHAARTRSVFRRALFALLALTHAAGCAHRTPAVDLKNVLTLRLESASAVLLAGQQIDVRFAVHNSSNLSLELCSPSGVTTYLESESRYLWPFIIHGWTTDTVCSGPFQLGPQQDKVFVERGGVRRGFPAGPSTLVGKISLSCDPRAHVVCEDVNLETRQSVQIQAEP
jgi:hypothetical protein